jgi:RNA polymerase sigma-70 factor (ECF subfamily)
LYAAHTRALHAFLLSRTGDDERAVDLLQETWLRVWQHIGDLQQMPAEQRRFWLFGIARNVLTDDYRRHARRTTEVADPGEDLETRADPATVNGQARQEMQVDLDTAIARLPEELRTVLVMSALGEMNSTEIGEALGCPPATVRYRLATARQRLVAMLGLTPGGN